MRSHMTGIATALMTTVMAVFGGDISRAVRQAVRGYNFVFRAGIFIFLVVFGYGALALLAGSLLARLFRSLDNNWLAPAVVIAFLVLAIIAEERRQF
jgi:hypothetical protein